MRLFGNLSLVTVVNLAIITKLSGNTLKEKNKNKGRA